MTRKPAISFILFLLAAGLCHSQAFIRTSDLFQRPSAPGSLTIYQNPAVDSLLSRYIIAQKKQRTSEGTQGMKGFRIQIYYNSVRTAREESAKVRAEFINKFSESVYPELKSYAQYQEPGWYMVRVGDFRSRTEGYKYLILVKKDFPNAYLVQTVINFPDLIR